MKKYISHANFLDGYLGFKVLNVSVSSSQEPKEPMLMEPRKSNTVGILP